MAAEKTIERKLVQAVHLMGGLAEQGGEGDDALSKTAIEEDGGGGVHQEEIGRIGLVFMRTVFH